MKIPMEIKIGYRDYKVKFVSDLNDGSKVLYGQVKWDEEIIELNQEVCENQKKCTLLHEVIHAIDEMEDIGLTEEQIVKLGKGMYKFIKDNEKNMFGIDFMQQGGLINADEIIKSMNKAPTQTFKREV